MQGKILPGYDASDNYWPRLFLVLLFHPSRTKDQSWKFSIQRGGKMIIGNEIVPRVLSPAGGKRKRKKEEEEKKKIIIDEFLELIISIDHVSRCEN